MCEDLMQDLELLSVPSSLAEGSVISTQENAVQDRGSLSPT